MKYRYDRPSQLADGKVLDGDGSTTARVPCVKWIDVKGGRDADVADVDGRGALIAEAFNVAAETGRTPRQLAAEREHGEF